MIKNIKFHFQKYQNVQLITICRNTSTAAQNIPSDKYGYTITNDGKHKRDRNNDGILNIGISRLPTNLKDSLKLYYSVHPKKRITQDGLRLSKHLKNRGRPTNLTWTKYKQQNKGRKKNDKNEVKRFSLEEAVKAGLVDSEELIEERSAEQANEEEEGNDDKKYIKKISKPKKSEYSVIRYGARETTAYVASQAPTVYAATYRALHEINKRVPDYKPQTLLDFGSGCGMTVWAAAELWRRSLKEYQCVDVSERMNETAEFLLRGGDNRKLPLKIPNVYFKRFLPISNQVKYDVVVSAFTLTELPFRSQRAQAIRSLWNKTNDFLVIVEPGNNEGFDTTLQARQFLLRSLEKDNLEEHHLDTDWDDIFNESSINTDGYIFAPVRNKCPHEQECARTYVETRDHPCNFAQKTEIPFSMRNMLKRRSYSMEKFSYIILRKGKEKQEEAQQWSRLLQEPKLKNRHVICELCCANGNVEKHIITKKKDPYVYKAVRHCLKWGDRMPLDEAKRPMNIRKSIPPTYDESED